MADQSPTPHFSNRTKIKTEIVFLCLAFFAIGFGVNKLAHRSPPPDSVLADVSRSVLNARPDCKREQGYTLIDPLILCDVNTPKRDFISDPLAQKLKRDVFDTLDSIAASRVSMYFRDLTTNRWTGINETVNYDPASLIKVPIMIAYYKEAESDPTILQKKIFYPAGLETETEFVTLETDKSYTVEELIHAMIVDSDNEAKSLLLDNINHASLSALLNAIGIPLYGYPNDSFDQISPKAYALFFQSLYGATYLNIADSEKALELLSHTSFTDGLAAGIPSGVTIAHKYGQYFIVDTPDNTEVREFHDCGIVYVPYHPYLLCVMSEGADLAYLEKTVQEISRETYQEVMSNGY